MTAAVSTNGSARPGRQVAQAVGIVSMQADCVIEDAFLLLSERALEMDCTLDDIAIAVIEHEIRFD